MPINKIALAQKITRKSVWEIRKKHQQYGEDGLKDHKSGRLFEPLSGKFYNLVIEEWKKQKCGARKLHAIFKQKGFKVSRQICKRRTNPISKGYIQSRAN